MPIAGFELSGYVGFVAVKFLGYSVFCGSMRLAYLRLTTVPCQLDANRHIQDDWPCPACRYNLKTLSAEGQCPECGALIRTDALAPPGAAFLLHALAIGFFRTLLGMCLGLAYWWLLSRTFISDGEALFGLPGLIPLRIIEWWLLIWLFFDRKPGRQGLGWRWVWYGILCSFFLDLPAVLGFLATGGIAVC